MKINLRLILVGTLLFCATAGFSAPLVTFDLKDATRDTGWRIRYDPDQISNPEFVGQARGTFQGLLTWRKDVKSGTPIQVSFEQLNNNDDNFGLRITLNEAINNQSGFDWTGFLFEVMDTHAFGELKEADNDSVEPGFHPGLSHFHGDFGGNLSGDVSGVPFTAQDPADLNGQSTLLLSGGVLPNGQGSLWGGFGIHQIEEKGQKRDFKLIERPVPEPGAIFGGLGVVALALAQAARRRRQRV